MSRRIVLWIAFVAVHLGVMWLGYHQPSQPMGDVYNVYEPWSAQALRGEGVVGVTEKWVYPQLALVPMVLAWLFAFAGYTPGWAILVAACDALGFAVLVGSGRSRGRVAAAWFWLAAIALLGPVAIYRLDAITVPLAIAGGLWLLGRPRLGAVLLAVATWIKVWPAALIAAAVIAARRRLAVLSAVLVFSAVVFALVLAAGGAPFALGFVTDQTGRGLQVEAPVSTVYLWQAMLGVPGSAVVYSPQIITFEVTGPSVDIVVAVMTPLLLATVVAVAALGAFKAWRRASFAALFPPLALALVLAFIVMNKVGSPQYMSWLVPPIAIALVLQRRRWMWPGLAVVVMSGLTQLVYPVHYDDLLQALPLAVAILAARNLGVTALFVWAVVRVARVPTTRRAGVPAVTR